MDMKDAIARAIASLDDGTNPDRHDLRTLIDAYSGNRLTVYEYCAWTLAGTPPQDIVSVQWENVQYAQDIVMRCLMCLPTDNPDGVEVYNEVEAMEDWFYVMDDLAERGKEPTSEAVCRGIRAIN